MNKYCFSTSLIASNFDVAPLGQLVEQPFGIFQIGGIEALREPAVDRREQLTGLSAPALVAPQPGEASHGAQLERF
jgi:hypothetical protein